MDMFFREYLMSSTLPNKEPWDTIVKLSIEVSLEGTVSPALPISLLVDLIDLTGLEECESIFKFIEDRLNLWKQDHFFNSCKNAVLRMCNGEESIRVIKYIIILTVIRVLFSVFHRHVTKAISNSEYNLLWTYFDFSFKLLSFL